MLINKSTFYVSEAATLLSCSSQMIYGLIRTGKLKAYKEEGHNAWKIPDFAIEDYMRTNLKKYAH
ncbi:helix-turn-helix domain-containing protein [Schwartzia succinivorans]|jgi:excisionase family DNA binding protein|uniref:DNA binding domain-containing protein, excisionase family n=1 Tax=Schwartzia succinivorans DSM 10502 TaxID=1123243 RepID=A0A1M4UIG6_9FIRM|nr:helix-turn-helix domain-containing protein [Schwartzia succinivorans]SHE56360.1 DNA binding domain-containing protein, excisionase family [Schwartzia succinivorans DSM 10502]